MTPGFIQFISSYVNTQTIADFGQFIGECVVHVYVKYHDLKKKCRETFNKRKHGKDGGSVHRPGHMNSDFDDEDMTAEPAVPVLWVLLIIIGYTALGGLILPLEVDFVVLGGELLFVDYLSRQLDLATLCQPRRLTRDAQCTRISRKI